MLSTTSLNLQFRESKETQSVRGQRMRIIYRHSRAEVRAGRTYRRAADSPNVLVELSTHVVFHRLGLEVVPLHVVTLQKDVARDHDLVVVGVWIQQAPKVKISDKPMPHNDRRRVPHAKRPCRARFTRRRAHAELLQLVNDGDPELEADICMESREGG